MTPGSDQPQPSVATSTPDVETMLATIASEEAAQAAKTAAKPAEADGGVQACDFLNPTVLSPRELRKLRSHEEEFVRSLAARLSLHLRLELTLKLSTVRTITYKKLAQSWATPSHLTLFKVEPLRGVSILEIAPKIGLAIVDRLMGGPGRPPETIQEISEIEQALMEQTVQLILEEWCGNWSKAKELKPVILGYETNGRFIQTAPPETTMLVLGMEAVLGECQGEIQIAFPFVSVESLISPFSQGAEVAPVPAAKIPMPAASLKWNACFDDVSVPVSAEWEGLEMTARAIINLKVGDVIPMDGKSAREVSVRLGGLTKFLGRPGTVSGQWAVELTDTVNP